MPLPPEPQQAEWIALTAILVPWIAIFGAIYAAIYFCFKFASESRDTRMAGMIDTRLDNKIHPLETKMDILIGDIAILKSKS